MTTEPSVAAYPVPDPTPASIDLGSAAWSTVYGFGGAWIQVDPPVDQLAKVDEATGAIVLTIDSASAVAMDTQAVWATVAGRETRKLDPYTGEILLTTPTPSANYIAVGAGAVWVPGPDGTVVRIDKDSGAVVASIKVSSSDVTDIAAAEDAVWVTDKEAGKVFRVDPANNSVTAEIATGAGAHDLAMSDGAVWTTNYLENTVSRIDPMTNDVTATIDGVGSGVGITAGDGAIWVSTKSKGISRIDPVTNLVDHVAGFAEWNYGLAYGDGELWVSSVDEGLVYRLVPPS